MSLATLFNVPKDAKELDSFSFHNQAEHTSIYSGLMAKLPTFEGLAQANLDPIPINAIPNWAYLHQTIHTQMCGLLGIAGSDFTNFNLSEEGKLGSWIELHAQEHLQAATALGIG
jgi:hypothetical protein